VLEDRTVPSNLAMEVPGFGVWQYNPGGGGWQQLTTNNASLVASDSAGEVVAAFPGWGVWLYSAGFPPASLSGAWTQITANDTAAGLDIGYFSGPTRFGKDTVTNVVAEFPGQGLWRYTNERGNPFGYSMRNAFWEQLTANNASTEAIDNAGEVVAEFPGQGVWFCSASTDWRQLTGADASSLAIGLMNTYGPAVVVGAFPGAGVWRLQVGSPWQQLTASDATMVGVNGKGDVVGEFPGWGVWRYLNAPLSGSGSVQPPGWYHLTAAEAAFVGIDDTRDVYGQFNGSGVWYFQGFGPWHYIFAYDASALGVGG
jgi:hypothetical protein